MKKANGHTKSTRQIIGERLTEALRRRRMSPYGLAKKADCPLSTVYRIVSGANEPGLALLQSLATALNVPMSDLLPPKPKRSPHAAKNGHNSPKQKTAAAKAPAGVGRSVRKNPKQVAR